MSKICLFIPFALAAISFSFAKPFRAVEVKTGTIKLRIGPIVEKIGVIRVALYDGESNFLNVKKCAYSKSVEVGAGDEITIQLDNIPYGEYAVVCFQDLNNNQNLDKNFFGAPKEPYAISNNVAGKWHIPNYRESKVNFNAETCVIDLNLKKWKDR